MSRPVWRFVVPPPGATLGDVVARFAPDASAALSGGRVFVDQKRASDASARVAPDAVVELYASRAADEPLSILALHAGFVFVDKPPGLSTVPDHAGSTDCLVARVERMLGADAGELQALSRLDVGVSGVVTLARDGAARALAAELRAAGRFARRYVAIASRAPEPESGSWSGAIGRSRDGRRRVGGEHAQEAATRYTTVARGAHGFAPDAPPAALLALAPITGRTHQLRVHAAAAGAALYGDRSYGGPQRVRLPGGRVEAFARPALHALSVELALESGPLRVESAPPEDFTGLWSALGGVPADLDHASVAAL
ncbi:MAG TPA: pseudouridine synthase [Polyangiaceae bacterium]